MDIRISRTWPKIGIETQRAQLNLRNNGKTDHTMSHTNPQILINSTKPVVHIDQTQCFADEGFKNIVDFAAESTQLAQKATMEFIQKKSQEGDSYARTYNKNSRPILDVIRENMVEKAEFNIGLIPSQMPEITVENGNVDMQVIEGQINIQYNHVPIETEFVPPQIRIYMEQAGKIDIEYIGNNMDARI